MKSLLSQTKSNHETIENIILSIDAHDELEQQHIDEILAWIRSGAPLFRIEKPATPPKHLVSYFVLIDEEARKLLLVDHKKAQLWLPSGGHVEPDEHPADAAVRECVEELGIIAEFWQKDPLFITSTVTVGLTAGHTDVSLWYVLKGDHHQTYAFDAEEFNAIRWFGFDEIPYDRTDPHMERFMTKLKGKIQVRPNQNEAFIKPNCPVVLSKTSKVFPNDKLYFYFCADSDFQLIPEIDDFTHRYTIRFCELFPISSSRGTYRCYDGYSLIIKKNGDNYTVKLANWYATGLDIVIFPQGIGIGSIILNHLFFWAKEMYPNLPVPRIQLSIADERDPENKARRDRLYSKIGLLDFKNKVISDLTPTIDTKDFEITPAYQFMREMFAEKQKTMKENKMHIETIQCLKKDNEYLIGKRYKYNVFQIHYQVLNLMLCIFDITIGNLISLFQIVRDKITAIKK